MSVFDIIWLEADDELTAVIEKIRRSKKRSLRLVIPQGAVILQSIINLRILKKSAQEFSKSISLVTQDDIGRRLATQVGIKVYERPDSAEPLDIKELAKPPTSGALEVNLDEKPSPAQVPVHHFQKDAKTHDESDSADKQATPKQNADYPYGKKSTSEQNKPGVNSGLESSGLWRRKRRKFGKFSYQKPSSDKGGEAVSQPRPRIKKPIIFAVAAVSLMILAFLFIPSAKVKLIVKGEDYQGNQDVLVSASPQGNQIKGYLLTQSASKTQKFPASGEKNIGTKASGTVTFYNSWSQDAQTIPAGTRLTKDGKSFVLVNDIEIPGASLSLSQGKVVTQPGQEKGQIQAQEPGEEFNVSAGSFVIVDISSSKQDKIYARADNPLTGGSSKTITVVSAQDRAQARQTLREILGQELREKAQQKAKNLLVLESASKVEFTKEDFSKEEGERGNDFELTLEGKLTAIGVNSAEYVKRFIALLKENVPGSKQLYPVTQDDEITSEAKNVDFEKTKMTITGSLKTKLVPNFSVSKLKRSIRNKPARVAQDIIKEKGIFQSVEVKTKPKWLRVPLLTQRIKFEVRYQ